MSAKFKVEVRESIWRCEDCGQWMSRIVPQGLHEVLMRNGRRVNCVGREVTP